MKANKHLIRFCIVSIGLYILWFLIYDLWLKPDGRLDFFISNGLSEQTAYILNLIGFDIFHEVKWSKHYISTSSGRILGISNACNGQVLYPLFAGFVMATPGTWKRKLLMILIGVVAIYLVNSLRVFLLCLIQIKWPQYLDFNHKYTFVILVYGFIFFLWMIWVNKVSDAQPIVGTKQQ